MTAPEVDVGQREVLSALVLVPVIEFIGEVAGLAKVAQIARPESTAARSPKRKFWLAGLWFLDQRDGRDFLAWGVGCRKTRWPT